MPTALPSGPMPARIVVLAREPVPGRVKTRLVPALGAEGAAEVHRNLVERTLTVAAAGAPERVELCCTPDDSHPVLVGIAGRRGVVCTRQGAGDLGERMARAAARVTGAGAAAVIIGTDCPVMSAAYLRRAADLLAEGADAVIGPAADGGYVLIGLRRVPAGLFTGVAWGSATVCADQCARLDAAGLRWVALPELWDLDRPEDLERWDVLRGPPPGVAP